MLRARCLSWVSRRASSSRSFIVDDPYTLQTYCELPYVTPTEVPSIASAATAAQKEWANQPLSKRIEVCQQFMVEFRKGGAQTAEAISKMMGKPLSQARGEINGMCDRVEAMISMAPNALADEPLPWRAGQVRFIRKEPVGNVLVVAPWNYPLLTAINGVIPAVLAGNAVLLKHSPRTPLCGDQIAAAFAAAGAPKDLVTSVHANNEATDALIQHPNTGFVSFTGSVAVGHTIYQAASRNRFVDVTLELGGKDSAYVAEDADAASAADSLVDGAFYNAGQSCCGIKRIFVHHKKYKDFVEEAVRITKNYVLGNPLEATTTLGPIALAPTAGILARQIREAEESGARVVVGGSAVNDSAGKGRFFQPTIVANCSGFMSVMKEESFGPLVAVQCVQSDEDAIEQMNNCEFGLSAAIYTRDPQRADRMMKQLQVGTVFMNRCDFLDPYLPWSGLKNTGKGCSLGTQGFRGMYHTKSCNFRLPSN